MNDALKWVTAAGVALILAAILWPIMYGISWVFGDGHPSLIATWIVGLVALISIPFVYSEICKEQADRKVGEMRDQRIKSEITPDYEFIGYEEIPFSRKFGLSVDFRKNVLLIWDDFETINDKYSIQRYNLSKILKIELENKYSGGRVIKKKGAIGRAAVGGLLFGGAGAIVGAISADQTTDNSNKLQSMVLKITSDESNSLVDRFCLFDITDPNEVFKNHPDMLEDEQKYALHWGSFIVALIDLAVSGVMVPTGLTPDQLSDALDYCQAKVKHDDTDQIVLLTDALAKIAQQ